MTDARIIQFPGAAQAPAATSPPNTASPDSAHAIERFSLFGPLPAGRHAVEASAGTGKTYTLAALVTRYVAETPHSIDRLLVVTFTRAAAAELRDRIRLRLSETAAALDGSDEPSDELASFLAADDRARRAQRLRQAVVDFDEATITTIHGFAQQMLATLGSGAPGDPDAELVENTKRLVDEVSTDLLVREALSGLDADDLPELHSIREGILTALANPGITIIPGSDEHLDAHRIPNIHRVNVRAALVREAAEEVRRRRRLSGTIGFDDLLTQLRDAMAGPAGAVARAELARRFPIVLIDEFQDTDPVQWDIFDMLGDEPVSDTGHRSLILVGDPKQAIYSFRGANVHAYLEAAHREDTTRTTLDKNFRSDKGLVTALHALFNGAVFGDERIGFIGVGAAAAEERALTHRTGSKQAALQIHTLTDPKLDRYRKRIRVPGAQSAVAKDLARRIHQILEDSSIPDANAVAGNADTGITGGDPGHGAANRKVEPSDIAVLIQAHSEAPAIQHALSDRGIPSVISRVGSVFDSAAAEQWRYLLTALVRPANPARARAAALSWFWGWSPRDLDLADDRVLHEVQTSLHDWSELLAQQGVIEMTQRIWASQQVVRTLLASSDGDRNLTDLEHIVELLHASTKGRPTSASGLLAAFESLGEPDEDVVSERLERRTGSQDAAVRILSVHASKGLEFPVVLAPFLWKARKGGQRVFQDPDTRERVLDPSLARESWPSKEEAKVRADLIEQERVGEQLRLLYVALTRAKHQAHVWWCPASGSESSPLARMFFSRDAMGTVDSQRLLDGKAEIPDEKDTHIALQPLVDMADGSISVDECPADDPPTLSRSWTPRTSPARSLEVAQLSRSLDRSHRRWSFSAISASDSGRGHAGVQTIDPNDEHLGDGGSADEPLGPEPAEAIEETAQVRVPTSPAGEVESDLTLGTITGGTAFGSLVHEVLEFVNFAAPDIEDEVAAKVDDALRWSDRELDRDVLVAGLVEAIETPLGPLFGNSRLRDLHRADRLDEMNFDMPLAGSVALVQDPRAATGPGTQPRPRSKRARRVPIDNQLMLDFSPTTQHDPLTARSIGRLIADHLRDDDPLRPWAIDVADGRFRVDLAGSLTGSIDGVFRLRAESNAGPATASGQQDRYVVVDYKSNRLGTWDEPLMAADYHPDLLPEAMVHHHYPLQALLYAVALHRYLRWRLRDYRPHDHLGGAAYLFLRGMTGANVQMDGARPFGVFGWPMPPELITDLSDLLDGRSPLARQGGL